MKIKLALCIDILPIYRTFAGCCNVYYTAENKWYFGILSIITQRVFTCSKSTMETPEQDRHLVPLFLFEQISHIALMFSLLTLSKLMPAG